ncbi:MAG: hypothetical protein HONBIEJF_00392 [Fimbriimonadaceae bacterium]|nr:hypothetical protein [Fimbriimonadaceae bacterium]
MTNSEKQQLIIVRALEDRIRSRIPVQFMTFAGTEFDNSGLEMFEAYGIDVLGLYLTRSRITNDAMGLLSRFPLLEELHIEETNITSDGLKLWQPNSLVRSLTLSFSTLEPDGWSHLASFTGLQELAIRHEYADPFIAYNRPPLPPSIDSGLLELSSLRNLKVLSVPGRDIEGPGLACVLNMPHLEVIVLDNTRVPAPSLRVLSGCTTLSQLHLSNTGVDDDVLIELADSLDILGISLANTSVTDRGILHLVSKGKLLSIFAEDVSWTQKACDAIFDLPCLEWAELDIDGIEHSYLETSPRNMARFAYIQNRIVNWC